MKSTSHNGTEGKGNGSCHTSSPSGPTAAHVTISGTVHPSASNMKSKWKGRWLANVFSFTHPSIGKKTVFKNRLTVCLRENVRKRNYILIH